MNNNKSTLGQGRDDRRQDASEDCACYAAIVIIIGIIITAIYAFIETCMEVL